ncbi:MAG TPA: redoxin family protein [Vicinamibacteria bacterium]|nr:redoxin family protein [Vicinamibacteria bacterium]
MRTATVLAWVSLTGSLLAGSANPQSSPNLPPSAPPSAPSVGDVIPIFSADAVDGSTKLVDFSRGSTTVLLFFLSGCPSCHRMIPEWNRAFERRPPNLRVVGVLMDQEPPGFFTAVQIAFPVVRSPGREFLKSLKVNRAPLTLRVSQGGKIDDLALGVIDPIRLGELFRP